MKERKEVRQRSREHWKGSKLDHDPQRTYNCRYTGQLTQNENKNKQQQEVLLYDDSCLSGRQHTLPFVREFLLRFSFTIKVFKQLFTQCFIFIYLLFCLMRGRFFQGHPTRI